MINDLFNIFLPQTCLSIFILIQILAALFVPIKLYNQARAVSLVGITLTAFLLSTVQTEPQYFGFKNSIMSDYYTQLFHFIILICGFFITLITKKLSAQSKRNAYTFQALLLTALLGAMLIISSNDFLTLFISIELLAFPTYLLIAFKKGYFSKEACFKYLITSAISTAVFLFGTSYLYGICRTFNFTEIFEFMANNDSSLLYSFAVIMIIVGLISKLAIFPFANWIIDVYKGAETSILAFLSTIPTLALFGILCRLLVFAFSYSFEPVLIIAILTIITAFWANTYAIKENNVKAIFACSCAANTSYVLLVASLVSVYNLSTVIFYLLCYVFMNISAFTFLNICENNKISDSIDSFSGLFHSNHMPVSAYIISVIALAGLPITSGFISKIYLFTALASSGLIFIPFLLILLLLMVFALFYYLKLILPLFERPEEKNCIKLKSGYAQKIVLYTTMAITILIGIAPEWFIQLCRFIAYNI